MPGVHPWKNKYGERGYNGREYKTSPRSGGGYHHSWYDPDRKRHISYDTDTSGDYVSGTGHERDDITHQTVARWD